MQFLFYHLLYQVIDIFYFAKNKPLEHSEPFILVENLKAVILLSMSNDLNELLYTRLKGFLSKTLKIETIKFFPKLLYFRGLKKFSLSFDFFAYLTHTNLPLTQNLLY